MTKTNINPNVCAAYEDEQNKYHIEVQLPGVSKDDIDLQVLPGGFFISAKKGDIIYRGDYTFCCPVKEEETEATYENGLLTIEIPLKDPYSGATKVNIK